MLSPRPLYKAGKPVQETWSLIFDNVRFGEILFPDMQTVCAELDLGERLLLETRRALRRRGRCTGRCDTSATRPPSGSASRSRRPGRRVEGRGRRRLRRRRRLGGVPRPRRGGQARRPAEVDFSGTSRQARTCINATALDAKTTVGRRDEVPVRPVGPFTSALLRSVDIVLPGGTIVSALPPDGAVFLYYEQNQAMISALLQAFAEALGPAAMAGDRGGTDIHNAYGVAADGTPWVSAAQCGGEIGPFGANVHGDADCQMLSYQANGIASPRRRSSPTCPSWSSGTRSSPDTAGPGYNRGGASVCATRCGSSRRTT